VAKLKAARDRKRATGAKVEGRKSYSEARPETVALARQFAAQPHYVTAQGRCSPGRCWPPYCGRQAV
jgi:DNA-binding phage protein